MNDREREETITDKEKRIFDLKKKNQVLNSFFFYLPVVGVGEISFCVGLQDQGIKITNCPS